MLDFTRRRRGTIALCDEERSKSCRRVRRVRSAAQTVATRARAAIATRRHWRCSRSTTPTWGKAGGLGMQAANRYPCTHKCMRASKARERANPSEDEFISAHRSPSAYRTIPSILSTQMLNRPGQEKKKMTPQCSKMSECRKSQRIRYGPTPPLIRKIQTYNQRSTATSPKDWCMGIANLVAVDL
jgi:hypothetical protein